MSSISQHVQHSLQKIDPVFYLRNKGVLDVLIPCIHRWMDHFYGKKGDTYDYSDGSTSHREQRHHSEGIEEAVAHFSKHFGEDFNETIKQEAERHVSDDVGLIPKREYYK